MSNHNTNVSAVRCGNVEDLEAFLQEGNSYIDRDERGWCLINHAAFASNLKGVKLILEKAKSDYESAAEIVKNVLTCDKRWETPMYFAIIEGGHNIVELLADLYIESGVDYETMDFPLHVACKIGWDECLKILVKKMPQHINEIPHGVDDESDIFGGFTHISGFCPLHLAVKGRNLECAKILMQNGCDINLESSYGQTVLHLAVNSRDYEMVKFFADKVDDINAHDRDDYTPIFLANELGKADIVSCLLDNGADETEIYFGNKKPAVIRAALHGNNDLLRNLYKEGVPTFDSDTEFLGSNVWISVLKQHPKDSLPETVKILLDNKTLFHSLTKFTIDSLDIFTRFDIFNHDSTIYFLPSPFAVVNPDVLTQFLDAGISEIKFDCKLFPNVGCIVDAHDKSRIIPEYMIRVVPKIITCLKYFPFLTWSHGNPSVLPTPDNFGDGDLVQHVPSLLNLTRWTIRCLIIKNKGMIHRKYVESLKLPKKITELLVKC